MKRMMLDLCSGFGGQSEAFVRGGYAVLRIDNNPLLSEVPHTYIADIMKHEFFNKSTVQMDYVHAGPTCHQFSLAFNAPRARAIHTGTESEYFPDEGIALVKRCKEIIDIIKPKYWSLENVRGSIKYLTPILGEPHLIVGPYVYWGNFPLFAISMDMLPSKSQLDKRHSPLRSNHRAECPLLLSQAFFNAMASQKSITDYQ